MGAYGRFALVAFAPAGLGLAFAAAADDPSRPTVTVRPAAIRMDAFYAGAQVEVTGRTPAGTQVVMVVRGSEKEESFNTKGRFGPIWANAGEVRIGGVPSLFLAFSSAPFSQLLSRAELDRRQLDTQAIEAQMKVEPPARDRAAIRQNYLKLKAGQGILRVEEGTVKVEEGGDVASYAASFRWPKMAPPARYTVTVFAVRDQTVVGEASTPLQVETVGLPASLAAGARQRATLYGFLCVLVATLAGLGIDFVASRMGGKVSAH